MRKILSLFLMLPLVLILVTACNETPNPSNTLENLSVSVPESSQTTDHIIPEQETLNYLIVQRGQDGLCVGLKNDVSDKLRTLGSYGLVSDVENLLWIAPRGGAGIDSKDEEKSAMELPVIKESDKSAPQDENIMWFYDGISSKNVWIRFNYQPFIPGQGMNVLGHKDLIVYIDPDNDDNAFLGIQDPQNQNDWNIYLLPGYGLWLEKEIDILLRLTAGM